MDPTRAPGAQPPRSRRSGDDRGRGLRRDEPGRVASHDTHRGALALVPVGRVRRPARVFPLDGVLDGTPRRPSPARARVAVLAAARSHPRRRRARHPAVLRRRRGPDARAAHGTPGRAQRQLLAARPSRPQDRSTRAAPDRLDSLRVQGREVGPPGIAQGDGSAVTRLTIALMIVLAVLASPIGASAQQPKSGGVFRIGIPDPPALDPHQVVNFLPQTVASLAYSHLLRFPAGPEQTSSTDFRILPDLAEKWEATSPTTFVFTLRRGVRFHKKPPVNGREVTADDVKYSLDRFRTRSPMKARFEPVQSIDVIDRYTVRIVLKEPFAPFLNHIASASHTAILPREAEEKFKDFNQPEAVIGTGPFVLKSYEKGVRVVFERNPDYFMKGLPYLDGVTFEIVP